MNEIKKGKEKILEIINNYISNNNWDKANDAIEKFIKKYPNNSIGYLKKIQVELKINDELIDNNILINALFNNTTRIYKEISDPTLDSYFTVEKVEIVIDKKEISKQIKNLIEDNYNNFIKYSDNNNFYEIDEIIDIVYDMKKKEYHTVEKDLLKEKEEHIKRQIDFNSNKKEIKHKYHNIIINEIFLKIIYAVYILSLFSIPIFNNFYFSSIGIIIWIIFNIVGVIIYSMFDDIIEYIEDTKWYFSISFIIITILFLIILRKQVTNFSDYIFLISPIIGFVCGRIYNLISSPIGWISIKFLHLKDSRKKMIFSIIYFVVYIVFNFIFLYIKN